MGAGARDKCKGQSLQTGESPVGARAGMEARASGRGAGMEVDAGPDGDVGRIGDFLCRFYLTLVR